MAAACPHCGTTLPNEELPQLSNQENLCPQCRRALDLASQATLSMNPSASETFDRAASNPSPVVDKTYALEVLDGNEPGKIYPIEKPRITIGRKNCDIRLDDPEISRQHVVLTVEGNTALLEDLGSVNGTFIEGQRIERERLQSGHSFRLGTHQLVFLIIDPES